MSHAQNQSESKLALKSLHCSDTTSLTFLLEITPSLSLTASHKSSRRQSSPRRLMASHKFSGDPSLSVNYAKAGTKNRRYPKTLT
ncbi:MAG: hypothetical protein EBZ49_10045 [Proteobacteria bacterium]|nr:hypothetical protein [Pseudomonadota bacterium]